MKKILLISLIILSFVIINPKANDDIFKGYEWYDLIETVEVNRELPHAYFIPYHDNKIALDNEKSSFTKNIYLSKFLYSLNGEWDFYFAENPYGMLSWNDEENWDVSNFDKITVPSNIQLQFENDGFKYDKPIYTNQIYPWINYEKVKLSAYPTAPTVKNGVAHYKKTFKLDESFNDRQIFINFDGIKSAFYLYVNGKKVGYSEDSYTTHQFNITSYLNKDEKGNISGLNNTVAVQLYRWSDGSYLENQDMIRLNGIFRDVYLISKADVEIRDFFIKPEIADNISLNLSVSLRNLDDADGGKYKIKAYLYDKNDKLISDNIEISYVLSKPTKEIKDYGINKETNISLNNIDMWSSEEPNLYRLLINLVDENDNLIEAACHRFGFRKIDLKILDNGKKQIILNGKPILIKGVNRHEFSSVNGNALSKEEIINDLLIIKQHNINAIRTSHYPNNVFTYELADELGIYVLDEANIESHYGAFVDDIPSYYQSFKNAVIDRITNMIERDKNYTSIIMYSLGNESTYKSYPLDENYNFYQATRLILEKDDSRLRLYERDNRYSEKRNESMVDVFSSQYYSLSEVENYLKSDETLPYLQSEYAHSMGNALGNLKEYWDIFRKYEHAQGGFIWDFKDQALKLPVKFIDKNDNTNRYFYAYGGDFGDKINDLEFSGNGIINADNSLSNKIYEVKKVYQSINFNKIDNYNYEIINENSFIDTNNYEISYEIVYDNKKIAGGIINENIAALSKYNFSLNKLKPGDDYLDGYINFYVKLKNDNNYGLKKGDIVAYEQFNLFKNNKTAYKSDKKFIGAEHKDSFIELSGDNFKIIFDVNKMVIKEYIYKNKKLFENGPYLNYTRAQISNDTQFEFIPNPESKYAIELENTMENYKIAFSEVDMQDDKVIIKSHGEIKHAGKVNLNYIIYADGAVKIENSYLPDKNISGIIPKVGMELVLKNEFKNVSYYGKGPYENYNDRATASLKGVYKTSVDDMFVDKYLKPQENGNRSDITWYKLDNGQQGILICGDNLQTTSIPYHYLELRKAKHAFELNDSKYIYLNINGEVRGLGNAICKDLPLEKYIISKKKKIAYSFMIIPFSDNLSDEQAMKFAKFK